jgi:hypothetical protein
LIVVDRTSRLARCSPPGFSAPAGFASLIASQFPPLFSEQPAPSADFLTFFVDFRARRFRLLRRGSPDGFFAKNFHRRCDAQSRNNDASQVDRIRKSRESEIECLYLLFDTNPRLWFEIEGL